MECRIFNVSDVSLGGSNTSYLSGGEFGHLLWAAPKAEMSNLQ